MFAIAKSLDEIRYRIPIQILESVFLPRTRWSRTNDALVNIDQQLLALVIRPRVLVDCNLVGGTEAYINLEGIPFERTNDFTSIYNIPKARTQGRSITSVLNVTFTDPSKVSSYGIGANVQNTTMLQLGSAVMDAMSNIPVTSTAKVQLIGENVIMVQDTVVLPANIYLRCILANDENMNHLQLKSYRDFSTLVVYAVKAYIYNFKIVDIDMAELHGGQALGKFKEIIDSYADAEDNYQTFLRDKWEKIAFMNSQESYTRLLKSILSGNH